MTTCRKCENTDGLRSAYRKVKAKAKARQFTVERLSLENADARAERDRIASLLVNTERALAAKELELQELRMRHEHLREKWKRRPKSMQRRRRPALVP